MNEARTVLLARREAVLVRIADQRRMLARNMQSLHRPLLCIELAADAWRLLSRHPGLLCGAAFAVAAWPRGTPARLVRRGWLAWQLVQGLRRAWRARAVSATRDEYTAVSRSGPAP